VTEAAFAVLGFLIVGWAVTSAAFKRVNLTGPMLFMVAGYVLGNPDWGPLSVDVEAPSVHVLAEITLALLLFSDAARVNVARLRHDSSIPLRLLGIGLPLSVLLGSLLAAALFGDLSWALAGFIGATLAPTDAALSAPVISDERIPTRLRRALNVESGLNDGIVTPVVAFALAVAAGQLLDGDEPHEVGGALAELAIGVGVGLAVGVIAAGLIAVGSRRSWIAPGGRRMAALAAALGSFAAAVAVDGNGFVAAFVAGVAFGRGLAGVEIEVEQADELPELLGELLALSVWFLFGAALVPLALHGFEPADLVYALLSLTAVRLLPVGLSLFRSGLDVRTVLLVGWFGPRGLASVVFALLAVEELGETPLVGEVVGVVALTVLLSVVLHGVSAGPLVSRYARAEAAPAPSVARRRGSPVD
jgi:sodium/hydrogen antiporter